MTMATSATRRALIAAGIGVALPAGSSFRGFASSDHSPGDPTANRTPVFDENFVAIDTSVWNAGPKATTSPQGHYGRAALSRWTGEAGFNPYAIIDDPAASDGKALQITAKYIGRPMNVTNYYGNNLPEFQWVSGNIQTARSDGTIMRGWREGYFEARMWFPRHPLTWPAFWLLNGKCILESTNSIEIDIVEHKGWELDQYGAYLHEWGPPDERHDGAGVRPGVDLTAGYHLYGILIEGARCSLYFDRKLVIGTNGRPAIWTMGRASQLDRDNDVFWPLLTLALRTDVPFPSPLRAEDRTAHLKIDWMRVYQ
jgi:beta-glucanase (GH16 family)